VGIAVGILSFVTLGAWTRMGGGPEVGRESSPSPPCVSSEKPPILPRTKPLIDSFVDGGSRRGVHACTPDVRRSDSRRVLGGHRLIRHPGPRPKPRRLHQ
jgi:hypothetical protein